jgi:transcriptional antiterminator RfaH
MNFKGQWYCLYTKPKQEKFAEQGLKSEGFNTYLPLIVKKTKSGRQFHERKVALFPSYLFASVTSQEDLTKMRSIQGVNYILRGQKHEPIEVPLEMLEALAARCHEGVFQPEVAEFKKGDQVELADSLYSGIDAVFQEYSNNKKRSIILLNILQGQHVVVDADKIKKVT